MTTWAIEWQNTLVTPLFVGGPMDGKCDEPRPRHALPLRIKLPMIGGPGVRWEEEWKSHIAGEFAFDHYVYRLAAYRDAFTAEYR